MKLLTYLRETQAEMKHVNWPTRKQTVFFTIVVVILSLLTAFFLGLSDFVLTFLLDTFVIK